MPGPYVISDLSLLTTLPGKDAVVPASDQGYGVQCVGLVKYYSSCGATAVWKEGDLVGESPGLARGTAIATFDDTGKYRSAASGNHACFFISFMPSNTGITVLEQHGNWTLIETVAKDAKPQRGFVFSSYLKGKP